MSISNSSGGWASEASRGGNYSGGPNRSNERSGGDNGGNSMSRSQFNSFFGGGGGSSPSGGGGNNQPQAPAPNGNMAMRSSLAELQRRDRAAVAALGPDFRDVNQASDVFNDDEEGINSIGEAIGRFGSWVQDKFGAGAPGGFAKSDAANGLATAGGFLVGGPVGAGVAGGAHGLYSASPGNPNTIGNVARFASGVPGAIGGIATLAGLVDEAVDLDDAIDLDNLPAGSPASAAAKSLNSVGLDDFPGGKQNDDPKKIKKSSSASTKSNASPALSGAAKVNPNTVRRSFSPLNLRFAALRGVPTIEDLL